MYSRNGILLAIGKNRKYIARPRFSWDDKHPIPDREAHLSLPQRRVMTAIEICRTAALGGHVERCEGCAHTRIAYNSCRNRHCPKCQWRAAQAWLEARESLQSQWMKAHGSVHKGLAATVLQRWLQEEREAGRDPDERMIQLFRTVAREEFGVTSGIGAPAPPSS